uniref:Uncharacterized protein n=1 Tax=Octopus bimaculoides TaxID=37653 RepID=A0A0L8FRW6_OCTBM
MVKLTMAGSELKIKELELLPQRYLLITNHFVSKPHQESLIRNNLVQLLHSLISSVTEFFSSFVFSKLNLTTISDFVILLSSHQFPT